LVQQDLALDCNPDLDYRGHVYGTYLGRGKKGNQELVVGFLNWIQRVFSYDPSFYLPPESTKKPETMNQGDMHSGPDGYSPNTAYPDTFYGSGGSDDQAHNEGDFNR
jgi:hypothetical protein